MLQVISVAPWLTSVLANQWVSADRNFFLILEFFYHPLCWRFFVAFDFRLLYFSFQWYKIEKVRWSADDFFLSDEGDVIFFFCNSMECSFSVKKTFSQAHSPNAHRKIYKDLWVQVECPSFFLRKSFFSMFLMIRTVQPMTLTGVPGVVQQKSKQIFQRRWLPEFKYYLKRL